MNFSLLIVIVMLAIVLPWLAKYFLPHKTEEKSPELFLKEEKKQKNFKNSEEQDYQMTDILLENTLLFSDTPEKFPSPAQKELLSDNVEIFSLSGSPFRGYELLQALYDVGLEYGEKNLFYKIKDGEILFSVAPSSPPYVFFLDEIGAFSTESLIFTLKKEEGYQEMKTIAEKVSEAF